MDNFDLHSYLRNNPLLKESVEKEEKKKLTKEEFKAMVKEMVLAETGVDEYLGGTMDVSKDYGMDDDSQTEGDFFRISLPNGFPVQYAGSYEEATAWVEKNDPEGMKDYQIDQVDESLNEMARIATFYVLTDDFEEAIAGMPENKQKSSRYQRVINYLKDNGQGTLKDIADEEFRTSETAAVSPIMADLVSYGVAKKGDLVAPKKEKPVGDGTRGRKMSDVGRVKSAMEKFKAGSFDYTDEERVALKAFIDSISATLEKESLNESVKEIKSNEMYSVKEPRNIKLDNGELPLPLNVQEMKLIEDFSKKENVKKLLKLIKLSPENDPICILSLSNKKMESRIIKFFKTNLLPDGSKSNTPKYYITINGAGNTSYEKEKHYVADNILDLQKLIKETLLEFSSWCDEQIKNNLI